MEACSPLCVCKCQPRKMPEIEHISRVKFDDRWMVDAAARRRSFFMYGAGGVK